MNDLIISEVVAEVEKLFERYEAVLVHRRSRARFNILEAAPFVARCMKMLRLRSHSQTSGC